MVSGDRPPQTGLEYPPTVRPDSAVTRSNPQLLGLRELSVPSIVLASGLALAFEGIRLASRARRRRAATKRPAPAERLTISYSWTQIVYERHERS